MQRLFSWMPQWLKNFIDIGLKVFGWAVMVICALLAVGAFIVTFVGAPGPLQVFQAWLFGSKPAPESVLIPLVTALARYVFVQMMQGRLLRQPGWQRSAALGLPLTAADAGLFFLLASVLRDLWVSVHLHAPATSATDVLDFYQSIPG